jgi:hypothetical protein
MVPGTVVLRPLAIDKELLTLAGLYSMVSQPLEDVLDARMIISGHRLRAKPPATPAARHRASTSHSPVSPGAAMPGRARHAHAHLDATPHASPAPSQKHPSDRGVRVAINGANVDRSACVAARTINVEPRHASHDRGPDGRRPQRVIAGRERKVPSLANVHSTCPRGPRFGLRSSS